MEIVNTEYFEVPISSMANRCTTPAPSQVPEDFALDELLVDPLHYLHYISWLSSAPPSSFELNSTSDEHNDGGANCFISNNILHFTNYVTSPLQVKQLNGSTITALSYGLKHLQCQHTGFVIPCWPCDYMPDNPQCTFSLMALKHFLKYPVVSTNLLDSLLIVSSTGALMRFPSIAHHSSSQVLDYHTFHVVRPKSSLLSPVLPPHTPLVISHACVACTVPLTWKLAH